MYHNPAPQRPVDEQETESIPINTPMPASLPLQPSFNNRNPPASPQSTALPPISAAVFGRETPTAKYYDPTQDAGDRKDMARSSGQYDGYPVEVCITAFPSTAARPPPLFHYPIVDRPMLTCDLQRRDNYAYTDSRPPAHSSYDQPYHSPVAATFPQPSAIAPPQQLSHQYNGPRADGLSQPPLSPELYQPYARGPPPTVQPAHSLKQPQMQEVGEGTGNTATAAADAGQMSTRTADPMSLSSIVSSNDHDSTPSKPSFDSRRPSKPSNAYPAFKQEHPPSSPPLAPLQTSFHPPKGLEVTMQNGVGSHAPAVQAPAGRSRFRPDEKEVEAELANINKVDAGKIPMQAEWRNEYTQRNLKRMLTVQAAETGKRKVCRTIVTSTSSITFIDPFQRRRLYYTQRFLNPLDTHANKARDEYSKDHEQMAWHKVQADEIAEEKERKKDMQRKRRREKQIANESQKRDEAMEAAEHAQDEEERERLIREARRHETKVRQANQLLHGRTPLRESTPSGLEGGLISTFSVHDETPRESKRGGRGGRWTSRPRKSREQKQAEKDQAAAAQAALDRGEDLPFLAPKEALRLQALRDREGSLPMDYVPYTSKAYHQIYESIWRDISRKDVPRVVRIKNESLSVKQSNLRKTAQLASKEARRWQLRTNKSTKDVQARAKRSMREMLSFWKRNERDERDQRKMAERIELENAKKAEAEREANRQRRKLNFLISQTELYSHFIGKKVKTAEVERSTDDVAASTHLIEARKPEAHIIDLPDSVAKVGTKVTNFDELDFDGDEEALKEAAMANAQHAVLEAQQRAKEFNDGGNQLQAQLDEGEMNFQNPTSLQSMDVPQPKMLACQLKEYQLKGLNWLVNLYEQGINGILADEMGLGKTVQSISVMAYLAETHNIWGPFLVIAPASTLHNWQQEISKFVPKLKVLPYWGTAKDRKTLRKFWDRKHITYREESPFHVLVTSYQLVVQDTQYFQKMKWQYMVLDEAQAIKSSQSSRWKSLLGFHCRNRLLLTGTPIQNNMQELWALLHFIMPSLFDSHDEFSDWFSKDIESHAQSNTKLNEDQLKRLHMILKPFMLRRIKKHVQKELGDKVELDVFCDLTYRQRAYYTNLRNKISIMDLIEKATGGDDQDTATLMNLVMQFRKVCNHPDLFERAETTSPFSFSYWAETASFVREGNNVNVAYSVRNEIEFVLPRLVYNQGGRLDLPGPSNDKAGWRNRYLNHIFNIWTPENIQESSRKNGTFSWLRFIDTSPNEAAILPRKDLFDRVVDLKRSQRQLDRFSICYDGNDENDYFPAHAMLNIVDRSPRKALAEITSEGRLHNLMNVSRCIFKNEGLNALEACARPAASAPPVEIFCSTQNMLTEKQRTFFNIPIRRALFPISKKTEEALVESKLDPLLYPVHSMLPPPDNIKSRFTHIQVPSMRRFVTDSGKLARLDQLLRELKEGGHRVLLYFQMTRMIDLMEEYLTYRNYKYCRLDGSTKLEDRRDTVADFQTRPEIFVFLLSTRAGGLGINLTSADTVIFYDSDWNPTIDSQAMDRAHRLGQTKQVTVYRMITRGTIEERIRKRALQKEEVQRVVISGQAERGVDFNTRSRENRTKDIAMWLADDEQAEAIEKMERQMEEQEKMNPGSTGAGGKKRARAGGRKGKEMNLDDMYHEGSSSFSLLGNSGVWRS